MHANLAQVTSLEELLTQCMRQKFIPSCVWKTLWDIVGKLTTYVLWTLPR